MQVHLDANGEVTDDSILSGPDELRRGVQQSILNWHFDKSVASTTQVVNVSFVKTPESTTPMVVSPAEPVRQWRRTPGTARSEAHPRHRLGCRRC